MAAKNEIEDNQTQELDPKKKEIFKIYGERSTRRKKFELKQVKVSELHNWGKITKIVEKSPTLKKLIDEIKGDELPVKQNYTDIFMKIMQEIQLNVKQSEMRLMADYLKENPQKKAVILKVDSIPNWAFQAFGNSVTEAVEAAAIKGLKFFICVSTDIIIV